MVGGRFVHHRRGRQRSAAPPELDDARIAGRRHAAWSEIRPHEEGAVVDPGGARLCLGDRESRGDELPGRQIKLTPFRRVRPAARQGNDAAPVFGLQAIGSTPRPGDALSLAQRIEVDHGLPHRIRAGVAHPCGPPPNAALVIGVLPEVVKRIPENAGVGDFVLRIENLLQPFGKRLIEQILDSKDKIASPRILGNSLYNFWQDADHERGIWRRTTWVSYASANPVWETVIDLDSLSKAEGVTWSWSGANCLEPEYRRCLLALSRGGSDATERREFDLTTGQFVAGGFTIPEAKTSATWVDDSTLLVGTNFGPGSMTTSGYARIIKLWRLGTPLS